MFSIAEALHDPPPIASELFADGEYGLGTGPKQPNRHRCSMARVFLNVKELPEQLSTAFLARKPVEVLHVPQNMEQL